MPRGLQNLPHKREDLASDPLLLFCCLESLPNAGDGSWSPCSHKAKPTSTVLSLLTWVSISPQAAWEDQVYFRNPVTPLRKTSGEEQCQSPYLCTSFALICISLQRKISSALHHEHRLWFLPCVKVLALVHPPPVSKQLSPSAMTLLSEFHLQGAPALLEALV